MGGRATTRPYLSSNIACAVMDSGQSHFHHWWNKHTPCHPIWSRLFFCPPDRHILVYLNGKTSDFGQSCCIRTVSINALQQHLVCYGWSLFHNYTRSSSWFLCQVSLFLVKQRIWLKSHQFSVPACNGWQGNQALSFIKHCLCSHG